MLPASSTSWRSISCRCSSARGAVWFDERSPEHIELERTRILEEEAGVTHMHYRVQR